MFRVIDGHSLDPETLSDLAGGGAPTIVDRSAIERATRPVDRPGPAYGRTTGVGANRTVVADFGDAGHDRRLWASHAAGAGPLLDEVAARAMLVVRMNQICAGPTGVSASCAGGLASALERGALPGVHRYGAVGTGDLTALAELGLCLSGRRSWWRIAGGVPAPIEPAEGDGLAFLSSNALTVGVAALATHGLEVLSRAAVVVTAMSALAGGASTEAFSPTVWAGGPPGAASVAAALAAALADAWEGAGPRLQDPYPWRAAPAWHGPLVTAVAELAAAVTREMNCSRENPLPDPATSGWIHHAAIIATELTARLDAVRAAVIPAAHGSLSRTRLLHTPDHVGGRAFRATGAPGSSGTMMCEYTAGSALAELRQRAVPAALGWVTLSLDQEDGASFATQSAFEAREMVPAYRAVLAAELVVTGRALRLGRWREARRRSSPALAAVIDEVLAALPAEDEDHDLGPDLEAAAALLAQLGAASLLQ